MAVRRGPWKLRVHPNLSAPTKLELYNLDEDPSEQFDLAADRPNLAADLLALMRAHSASITRGS